MRSSTLSLALGAVLATAACRGTSQTATPAGAEESRAATVSVTNRRFYDMNIYVGETGGTRTRLGLAPGNATTRLTIPAFVVSRGGLLRFVADPVGPSGVSRSEELRVLPGDEVSLTIEP